MNLSDLLKAPGLPIALACALFLHLAPRIDWMPAGLNPIVANIGIIAASLAIVLPLADAVAGLRRK
jgi:hypothetical protein